MGYVLVSSQGSLHRRMRIRAVEDDVRPRDECRRWAREEECWSKKASSEIPLQRVRKLAQDYTHQRRPCPSGGRCDLRNSVSQRSTRTSRIDRLYALTEGGTRRETLLAMLLEAERSHLRRENTANNT